MPTDATFLIAGLFLAIFAVGYIYRLYSDRDRDLPPQVSADYLRGLNLVLNRRTDEALELFVQMAKVDDDTLMGSDAPPGRYQAPQGIYVAVHPKTYAEAERIFNELSAGGSVEMPFQKTFWSPGFGMTRDRFGIPWMVNCETAPA